MRQRAIRKWPSMASRRMFRNCLLSTLNKVKLSMSMSMSTTVHNNELENSASLRLLYSNCLNWKFTAKITYHLHIYPQFIYESFHIHCIISLLSRENMNSQLTSLPMCGFIAQLVEHCIGIAEVTGSNPVEALIFFFFQASLFNCLNWKFTAKITYHLHKNHRRRKLWKCNQCELSPKKLFFRILYLSVN